jgi:tetratricopeptide (TPR) repeat protein
MPKRCSKKPNVFVWRQWIWIAIAAVLFFESRAESAILANQNKRGLRAYTIEGVLRLDDSEIDLGSAALILSREWGTQRTTHVYRRKIDDMAEAILNKLNEQHVSIDYRAIPVINAYLFDELGFTSVDTADNPEDLFLHVVLDKKRGYCLSLSVLYLSIAERLGLPMYGVVVPGHFFVRYDDGRRRYNIETTSKGASADDEHYLSEFKPPNRPQTLYMKNLTPKQTLGCFYNNLGNSYMAIGDTEKAFEVLLRAVQINPLLSEANMNLGNIYLQKKMSHPAIAQYEKALTILGSDAKAMNNLGSAYMQLNNYTSAESWYKSALKLDPGYTDVYRNLAAALQMQGKFDEALSQLQAAVVLNPQDAAAFALLGQICRELQQFPDSEKYLLKALSLDSSLASTRLSLGYLYLDQKNLQKALETFQEAVNYRDAAPQAYFGLAQIYHQQEQIDDEIQAYEQALSIESSMVAALQNLGNAYHRKGSDTAAIEVYQKAIRIDPKNADIHYNLGVTLAGIKEHDQAVAEFSQAIQLDADNAPAYNGLAISYYHLGNTELARTYARKAKALGYDVPEALLK